MSMRQTNISHRPQKLRKLNSPACVLLIVERRLVVLLSISEPNFTKSEGKVRFGQFFLLCKDTGLSVADLRSLMADRELWAETVRTSSSKEEML